MSQRNRSLEVVDRSAYILNLGVEKIPQPKGSKNTLRKVSDREKITATLGGFHKVLNAKGLPKATPDRNSKKG